MLAPRPAERPWCKLRGGFRVPKPGGTAVAAEEFDERLAICNGRDAATLATT